MTPHAPHRTDDGAQAGLVFNLVWTEGAFEYLGLFTLSLLAHSSARYRLVANGCQPEELRAMERFAGAHPEGITDVAVVATDQTLRHGDALDRVWRERDDGSHFCLIDPDIAATGDFLDPFLVAMADHAAVTSGRELWSDSNVLPEGHPGLNGEYFFRADGFLFGSPHFAIYDGAALGATIDRWGVGFGEGGNGLSPSAREALRSAGHDYMMYDTGKVVNLLLQLDGRTLHHLEHDALVHVGGLLHYLWAPRVAADGGEEVVDWARWRGMTARHEVARYAAATLRALLGGSPAPTVPPTTNPTMQRRLALVRSTMTTLVDRHGEEWLALLGRPPGPEHAATTSYHAWRGFGSAQSSRPGGRAGGD